MERLYNVLPNEVALIAQVGSENKAWTMGDSVGARDLTANDGSQPTPKIARPLTQHHHPNSIGQRILHLAKTLWKSNHF
jgi:hypothetical protein